MAPLVDLTLYKKALEHGADSNGIQRIVAEAEKILIKLEAARLTRLQENVDAPSNKPYDVQRKRAYDNIAGDPSAVNKVGLANGFTRTIDAVNDATDSTRAAMIVEAVKLFQELQLQADNIREIDRRVKWLKDNPGKDPLGGGFPPVGEPSWLPRLESKVDQCQQKLDRLLERLPVR